MNFQYVCQRNLGEICWDGVYSDGNSFVKIMHDDLVINNRKQEMRFEDLFQTNRYKEVIFSF